MSSFLEKLIQQNTRDIQGIAGHKLGESMRAAERKESGWRSKVGILKTLSETFLPPGVGHLIGATIDPIGRNFFGQGADEEDITLDEDYQIFGGKGALTTAKEGLGDAIEDYKQANLLGSVMSFAGNKASGAVVDKWGGKLKDIMGFGGDATNTGVGLSRSLGDTNEYAKMMNVGSSYQTGDVLSGLDPTGGVGIGTLLGNTNEYAKMKGYAGYAEGGEVKSSNPFRKSQESGNQWWSELVKGRKEASTLSPKLQKMIQKSAQKNIKSSSYAKSIVDAIGDAYAKDLANFKVSPLEQRGEDIFSSPSFLDSIQKVSGSGLNLPEGVSQMSRYIEGATHSPQDIINSLMQNPSDARYLDKLGYTPEMLKQYSKSKLYEQGGMVQKYQESQTIEDNILHGTGQQKYIKVNERTHTYDTGGYRGKSTQNVWDLQLMTWDGQNWVEGGIMKPKLKKESNMVTTWENYNMKPLISTAKNTGGVETMESLKNYRIDERTEAVTEKYMEGEGTSTGGVGLTEFKRDADTAALVNLAKTGDEEALKDLAEIARQTRPKLANASQEELIKEIKENLTSIDLGGQGFTDLEREKATSLRGVQSSYDTGLGQVDTLATSLMGLAPEAGATGMGTSQRGMRQGMGDVSEKLSDLFTTRQADIADIGGAYTSDVAALTEKQFDPLGTLIGGLTGAVEGL